MDSVSILLFSWLQTSLLLWGPLVVWFAVFLTGENGALLTFAFAAQGLISVPDAIVFSFLGSLSADLFWYFVTTSTIRPWYERRLNKKVRAESQAFISIADTRPYALLIILKFLVGVRLFLTIYILTRKKIPFRAYLLCTVLGNMLFVAVLLPIGWLLGVGVGGAFAAGKGLMGILTIAVVVVIVGQILFRFIRYTISRAS